MNKFTFVCEWDLLTGSDSGNAWYTVPMKSSHKLETPSEEMRKKMRPIRRAEFTELVQKAIRTPNRKTSARTTSIEENRPGKE